MALASYERAKAFGNRSGASGHGYREVQLSAKNCSYRIWPPNLKSIKIALDASKSTRNMGLRDFGELANGVHKTVPGDESSTVHPR